MGGVRILLYAGIILLLSSLFLACGSSGDTDGISFEDFDNIIRNVALRPGVKVDIFVRVYENDDVYCNSLRDLDSASKEELLDERTILAVHGRNTDGDTMRPLAEALFDDNPTGDTVCRFLALDLPGHGNSSLPIGDILFGELSHSDYVAAVLATVDNLAKYDVRPKSLIGFSTGGAVVRLTQQTLIDNGTDLYEKYQIERVTLFAPVPTAPVFWQYLGIDFASTEAVLFSCFGMEATTQPCSDVDFINDGMIDWDDINYLWFDGVSFDCDPATVPLGEPPFEAVPPDCQTSPPGLGDIFDEFNTGQPEPFNIVRESVDIPPQIRISTDSGIFEKSKMPELQIVVFKNDDLIGPVPDVGEDMYIHLTGDDSLEKFKVAEDGHLMIILNPTGILESMAGTVVLP